jgi:hypothetical protein
LGYDRYDLIPTGRPKQTPCERIRYQDACIPGRSGCPHRSGSWTTPSAPRGCRPAGCHLHTATMKALRRTWPTNAPTSHRDRSDRSRCPSRVAAPLIAPQSVVKPLSRPGPLRYRYGSWREHRDEDIKRDSVGRAPSWHADRPPTIKALHRPLPSHQARASRQPEPANPAHYIGT